MKNLLTIVVMCISMGSAHAQVEKVQHAVSFQYHLAYMPLFERDLYNSLDYQVEFTNRFGATWEVGRFGFGYDYFYVYRFERYGYEEAFSLHGPHVQYRIPIPGKPFDAMKDGSFSGIFKLAMAKGNYCYSDLYRTCQSPERYFIGFGLGGIQWMLNYRWAVNFQINYYQTIVKDVSQRDNLMWAWLGIKYYAFYRFDKTR